VGLCRRGKLRVNLLVMLWDSGALARRGVSLTRLALNGYSLKIIRLDKRLVRYGAAERQLHAEHIVCNKEWFVIPFNPYLAGRIFV